MATQKQRRRRAKEKRHDYDLVEIDGEGNETVLSASELKSSEPAKPRPKAKTGSGRPQPRSGRGTPQPPSWSKVLKRGAMFAPVFLLVIYLLGRKTLSPAGLVIQAILLLAVFVPFSYFMDHMVWRSHQKRMARDRSR